MPHALRRDPLLEARASALLAALGCHPQPPVRVSWNHRLRTTAGRADLRRNTIHLNPALLQISHDEVQRTFLHELAHILARHRNRRASPHGREWRKACADLGIPGEPRCHTLDLAGPRRPARKYLYCCILCGKLYPRVRPLKRAAACGLCCRRHFGGLYDARCRLVEVRTQSHHPGQPLLF